MILLSARALMQKKGGQSLVGGLNVEICRNYFGAQTSSFEVPLDTSTLEPGSVGKKDGGSANKNPYPAVFIRAPAVLEAGPDVDVLCKVRSRPCNKAVTVMKAQLKEEDKDDRDDDDDTSRAKRRRLAAFFVEPDPSTAAAVAGEGGGGGSSASSGEKEAPEVIVAIRKGNIVGTAFHPELTNDSRWHEYFVRIVKEAVSAGQGGVRDGESPAKTPVATAVAAEAKDKVAVA
ncbi:unnamed protein product [Ectocarpus fasciculatus]